MNSLAYVVINLLISMYYTIILTRFPNDLFPGHAYQFIESVIYFKLLCIISILFMGMYVSIKKLNQMLKIFNITHFLYLCIVTLNRNEKIIFGNLEPAFMIEIIYSIFVGLPALLSLLSHSN
jgi:hypothetical protein